MLNPRAPERLVHAAPFGGEPGLLSPRAGPRTRAVVCGGALGLLLGLLAALQPLSHGPPHAQHMSVPRTAPPTAVSPLRAPAVPQSAGGRTPTGTPRRPLVDGGAPATPAASAVEAGAPASAAADQNASPIAALGVALLALGAGLWGYARRGPAPLDGAPAPATSAAVGRRAFAGAGVAAGSALLSAAATAAAEPPTIAFPSGLQVQDFKEGTGPPPRKGTQVTIDYVMSTTGARYGSKIDSTRDRDEPFTFLLGDENIIQGLQEAVLTMRGGGIRRAFIPASLGYTRGEEQGPIPPGFAEFQRWRNIYANPNRPYQPELVLDIKLYTGAR